MIRNDVGLACRPFAICLPCLGQVTRVLNGFNGYWINWQACQSERWLYYALTRKYAVPLLCLGPEEADSISRNSDCIFTVNWWNWGAVLYHCRTNSWSFEVLNFLIVDSTRCSGSPTSDYERTETSFCSLVPEQRDVTLPPWCAGISGIMCVYNRRPEFSGTNFHQLQSQRGGRNHMPTTSSIKKRRRYEMMWKLKILWKIFYLKHSLLRDMSWNIWT